MFRDLGFSAEESQDLVMRSYLIARLQEYIERRAMTQVEAAQFLGVTQSKISYIKNGHIDKFSIDFLIRLLSKTGGQLRYSFRMPAGLPRKPARARQITTEDTKEN